MKNVKEHKHKMKDTKDIKDTKNLNAMAEVKNSECECNEKYANLEEAYKRSVADYANLSRRTEEDKIKMIKFANEVLIMKLINVLDDMEESQKHLNDDGVGKIIVKFKKILEDEGLAQVDESIIVFDPTIHEAMDSVDGEAGIIVKTIRKGYLLNDKVIRPALVSVGNGKNNI